MADSLFPTGDEDVNTLLHSKGGMKVVKNDQNNAAVELIRQKVATMYTEEPDAKQELADTKGPGPFASKHQRFIHELNNSGKSLPEIQTEWHNYYTNLSDKEKHEVWQEFYDAHASKRMQHADTESNTGVVVGNHEPKHHQAHHKTDTRSRAKVKSQLLDKVSAGGKLKAKHHLQSLAFGLATGLAVLVVFLFGFFNEVIIAPFIQPNSHANATPVILDPSNVPIGSQPEVIIPKINVEIPVDYSQTTTNESQIENALNSGVVHYPTTVLPGQKGNAAFFGHSSNNIFNPGKYKFAFVLLHELVPGDTFYLTKDGKAYVYKVISKNIVPPTQVSVLDDIPGQTATATLITCDPPGTSLNRLVVVGEQVSPDPSGNSDGNNTSASGVDTTNTDLPGNGPTLWSRFWHWLF